MNLTFAILLCFTATLGAASLLHSPQSELEAGFRPYSKKDLGSVNPDDEKGPMKPALIAFHSGQYEKAFELARALAKENDPSAYFLLGYAAETGTGVEQSIDKALDYYQKAGKSGHKDASYRRALILVNSEDASKRQLGKKSLEEIAKTDTGVANRLLGEAWLRNAFSEKPNPDKVIESWSAAVKAGDSDSLILLARLRSGNYGFPDHVDPKAALQLYSKAAEEGDERAYLLLGSLLLNGLESARNEIEGRKWLNKAIGLFQIDAYLALGDYEQFVKKDDKAAFKTYLNGAIVGQLECAFRAGIFLYTGKGVDINTSEGAEWLNKAADAGHPHAAFELFTLLSNENDPDMAVMYSRLIIAAEGGLPQGMDKLALFYITGSLGAVDYKAAVSWYTDAAKAGYAPSQYNLASLFERGVGVNVNFQNAGNLYTLAANQGHAEATTALARLHVQGKGVKQDVSKSWALAKLAKERGDQQAQKLISEIEKILTPKAKVQGEQIYKKLSNEVPSVGK